MTTSHLAHSIGWANAAEVASLMVMPSRSGAIQSKFGILAPEVVPFWVLSFVGLAFSSLAVYLAGSFACTPVVKYPLDEIKEDNKVKGVSMIEMGNGNRPLNMFSYEKEGKGYVLMNTFRFHHKAKPFGPSPYWTVRFERDLLAGQDRVNEKAVRRLDGKFQPVTDRITLVPAFHGVVHMDLLGKDPALRYKFIVDSAALAVAEELDV